MLFRKKAKHFKPLRYFIYLSRIKLQILLDQIGMPVLRSIAAQLKIDLKLVSLTLSSTASDKSFRESSMVAKLEVVENYLKAHQPVGDLNCSSGYFEAVVMMDWSPCDDDETVLFCGYSGSLIIVLAGSVSNLLGRPFSATQIGSHPYKIQAAIHLQAALQDGRASKSLGTDINKVTRQIYNTPQPLRFLAHLIYRGDLPANSKYQEYILATPLYVEIVDSANILARE